jgi:hypothetical protein
VKRTFDVSELSADVEIQSKLAQYDSKLIVNIQVSYMQVDACIVIQLYLGNKGQKESFNGENFSEACK